MDAVVIGAENAHAGGRFLSVGSGRLIRLWRIRRTGRGREFGRYNAGLLCDLAHCGAATPHPNFLAHFQATGHGMTRFAAAIVLGLGLCVAGAGWAQDFGTCGPLLSLAGVPQRRLRRQVGPRCARASPCSARAEPASRPGRDRRDDAAARLPAQLRMSRAAPASPTSHRPLSAACTDHHHLHRRHRERWAMHLPGRIPVDGGGHGSRRHLRARQRGQLPWRSDDRRRRVPVQRPGHDVRTGLRSRIRTRQVRAKALSAR